MHARTRRTAPRSLPVLAVALAILLAGIAASPPDAAGQVSAVGEWRQLSGTMPINPIHVALLRTGRVLVVAGTENDPTVTTSRAAVWNPATGAFAVKTVPWDLFCNGMAFLPDGRVLIVGGNLQYNPFRGIRTTTVFDPATERFMEVQEMARGRWYPSVLALPDGRTATFSGWLESGGTNNTVEFYRVPSGWSQEFPAPFVPPLYPWLHLLPDGRVFHSGAQPSSHIFNPTTRTWTTNVARTLYGEERTYGSSVLLPLRAAEGYRARVMIMGGDNPATASAEIIDLSQGTPAWRALPPMSAPRIQMNAVLLPNGTVLALGGSAQNNSPSTASLDADLFDPASQTWSPAGRMRRPRMYHSVALLLPDATVWVAGSNPQQGSWDNTMEVYRPPYLFTATGSAAPRPTISAAPPVVGYGATFGVTTPDAADIASVALVRPGSSTHAFDFEQRLVDLSFTASGGTLSVTAPPNANIAPPGWYMLFLVNRAGTPSVAAWVRLSTAPDNEPPRGTITSPSADVTIRAGERVTFAGSGTDPDGSIASYTWIFPGGSPRTSTVATPGAVTFSTPGTYDVSLTVVDNRGANDPSPPVRKITVQPATLTASFTSPPDGAVVAGTQPVGMAVSGASGSSNTFTLAIDGTQVFTTTTSGTTASFSWNTTGWADGPHTLTLTVRDASGATATATRAVTVNNSGAPTDAIRVSFPTLTPGQTLTGTVTIRIRAEGTSGASNRFAISVDGVQRELIVTSGTTVDWSFDTTTVPNGSRTLSVRVTDATGRSGTAAEYVSVQNVHTLSVIFTRPSAGATVSGTAWVDIWVEGVSGSSNTFSLWVAGVRVAHQTISGRHVTFAWDTRQTPDGPQTMLAVVRDATGRTGQGTRAVVVQNGAAPPPPPPPGLTAAFTSPAAGSTVSGTVTVGLAASGGTPPYTYRLTIDGTQVFSTSTSATSASYAWNTTTYTNASHTLALTVTDAASATASATRTVTVSNSTTPPPTGTLKVAITAPKSGATVSGTTWATVWVEGAGTGTKTYTLLVGGQTVATTATTSSGPVSLPWDTTRTPDGTQTLTARVDAGTDSGQSSVTVTVSNGGTPPPPATLTASFTSPAAGSAVSGTVTVGLAASGGTAPYTYRLSIDGVQVFSTTTSATSASYSWNTTTYSDASHALALTVTDAAAATASATRSVTVDNSTGGGGGTITVALTSPKPGSTVSGTVWVNIWLTNAAAGPRTFTMSVAGETVWSEVSSADHVTLPWVTTDGPNGQQTLLVTVRDSAGATGSQSVTVTVQNP